MRKAGNRLRITVQLIDATSGAHTWADRFEGALEDVFAFQDEVTVKAVAAIAPRVERAEIERAKRRPPGNTDAYDWYLRGLSCLSPMSADSCMEAMRLFTQASALDPDYAVAYTMTMWCRATRIGFGFVVEYRIENEVRLWQLVTQLGQDDGVALSHASWAVAFLLRDLASARQLVDRAVELNPNLAAAWANSGWICIWLGHWTSEHLGRAQRLGQAVRRELRQVVGDGERPLPWADTTRRWLWPSRCSGQSDQHAGLVLGASAALTGHGDAAHRLVSVCEPSIRRSPSRASGTIVDLIKRLNSEKCEGAAPRGTAGMNARRLAAILWPTR